MMWTLTIARKIYSQLHGCLLSGQQLPATMTGFHVKLLRQLYHKCASAERNLGILDTVTRPLALMTFTEINGVSPRHLHSPSWLREAHSIQEKKRTRHTGKHPYLIDKDIAKDVAKQLKPYIKPGNPVYICNPGQGQLVEALLQEDVNHVVVWEANSGYLSKLEEIGTKFKKKLEVHPVNFFQACVIPKGASANVQEKVRSWEDDAGVTVIGSLDPALMTSWTASCHQAMARKALPYHRGRAEFFIFVTGREHQLMTDPEGCDGMPGPCPRRVITYQLFNNISTLLKIPFSAFSNIPEVKIPKTATWDRDSMYLVHLTTKQNLFDTVCPAADLPTFLDFCRQLFRTQRARLVPRLEQWTPGIGIKVIDLGYSMLDNVKHLQAQHWPIIFKEIQKQGGFQGKCLLDEDVQVELSDEREPTTTKSKAND